MARIEDLINEVADPGLRDRLARVGNRMGASGGPGQRPAFPGDRPAGRGDRRPFHRKPGFPAARAGGDFPGPGPVRPGGGPSLRRSEAGLVGPGGKPPFPNLHGRDGKAFELHGGGGAVCAVRFPGRPVLRPAGAGTPPHRRHPTRCRSRVVGDLENPDDPITGAQIIEAMDLVLRGADKTQASQNAN